MSERSLLIRGVPSNQVLIAVGQPKENAYVELVLDSRPACCGQFIASAISQMLQPCAIREVYRWRGRVATDPKRTMCRGPLQFCRDAHGDVTHANEPPGIPGRFRLTLHRSKELRSRQEGLRAGKNSLAYRAHSYHTKVPPEAIEKLIRHHTNEGSHVGLCDPHPAA